MQYTFGFETAEDRPALKRLAGRLRAAGNAVAEWPERYGWNTLPGAPTDDDFPVRRRRILAWSGGEVRAHVNFFEHQLWINKEFVPFVWPNGVLSEGIVDTAFRTAVVALFRHVHELQPNLLNFGAIGQESPMARLMLAMRWRAIPTPTLILPLRPSRIARAASAHACRRLVRTMATLGRATGAAGCMDSAFRGLQAVGRPHDCDTLQVDHFGPWADKIWDEVASTSMVLTRRDADTLNRLYRPGDSRIRRVIVMQAGVPVGWAILNAQSTLTPSPFGPMKTVVLGDVLAVPGKERLVLQHAIDVLHSLDADICLSTLVNGIWSKSARRLGFMPFRRDSVLFVSTESPVTDLLDQGCISQFHLTRGDCDGPIHYDMTEDNDCHFHKETYTDENSALASV